MTPGHPLPSVAWMVTGEEPSVVGVPENQTARREREAGRQRATQHREDVGAGPAGRRELLAVRHRHPSGGQRRRGERNHRARRRGNDDRVRDDAGTPTPVRCLNGDRGGAERGRRPRDQAARGERETRRQRATQHREDVGAGPAARRELLAVGHRHPSGGSAGGPTVITGHAAAAMTIVYAMVPGHPFPSLAWMVTVEEPSAVGVPAIRPPEVSVRPAGSAPLNTEKT